MAVERKFIQDEIKKLKVDRFVHKELERIGCGKVEVKRTPLGNRIIIHSSRPGLVIGRKGKNIESLTNALEKKFNMDHPQLEVQEITKPEFDAELMAKQVAGELERGIHFRRTAYGTVRRIMRAGALGCELTIHGKVSGGRTRQEKFKEGYIKHCGETALRYVKTSVAQARLKAGALGVRVKITPPLKGKAKFGELAIIEPIVKEEAEKPKIETQEPTAKTQEPKTESKSKETSKPEQEPKKTEEKKDKKEKKEATKDKKSAKSVKKKEKKDGSNKK